MAEVKAEEVHIILQDHQPLKGDSNQGTNEQTYNPYQMPADHELAKSHGKAKKVYACKNRYLPEKKGSEACVCCNLPLEGKEIPLNANLAKLYHLGSGFALYFQFIKYSIGLLMLLFIVEGIFNIATNLTQGDCSDDVVTGHEYCVKGYILSFTIPNKRDSQDLLTAQLALNLATIILIMLCFHYLRYQFRKTKIMAEDTMTTPADYTIVIENMPSGATKQDIIVWIKGIIKKEPAVKRIIRPYDISEFVKLVNKKDALTKAKVLAKEEKKKDNINTQLKQVETELTNIREYVKLLNEKNTLSNTAKALSNEGQKVKEGQTQLQQVENDIKDFKKARLKECSLVYVTFANAKDCDYFQSKFQRPLLAEIFGTLFSKVVATSTQFKGKNVKVKRAPEPNEIMWENLGYTEREKGPIKLKTTVITIILIAFSFGLIILVNWGKHKTIENLGEDSFLVQILSVIASLVIFATNYILAMTIDFLARYEKHFTYTNYLKGVAEKLVAAQFFNTALTNLFSQLIIANPAYGQSRLEAINFYGKGGLLEGMFWVFITNAFMTPALTIFNPMYIMKRGMQYLKEKKGFFAKYTQKELNQLYEGPNITMPSKFATMINMVLITAFYAPALPFALIFTIVGLGMCYWSEKYALLRRNSLPNYINSELADSMVEVLEWSAFTFAVGNIFYVVTLKNSANDFAFSNSGTEMAWIALGVSLFHIIFPMELLNTILFPIKDEVTETQVYEKAKLKFNTDYDFENPLSRTRALKEHIAARLKNKGVNDDQRIMGFLRRLGDVKLENQNLNDVSPFRAMFTEIDNCNQECDPTDEDQIDLDYLDSYAKQLEVHGSKLDQNTNPLLKENNLSQFGKIFGNLIQSTPDGAQKASGTLELLFQGFPELMGDKPSTAGFTEALGGVGLPYQESESPIPAHLCHNTSPVKLNNGHSVINLFNLSPLQEPGVSEKSDMRGEQKEEKMNSPDIEDVNLDTEQCLIQDSQR